MCSCWPEKTASTYSTGCQVGSGRGECGGEVDSWYLLDRLSGGLREGGGWWRGVRNTVKSRTLGLKSQVKSRNLMKSYEILKSEILVCVRNPIRNLCRNLEITNEILKSCLKSRNLI